MSNERIDLEYLLEEDSLLQDLNWSIARFEQVEKLVKEMTAELKRCYKQNDLLTKAFMMAGNNGCYMTMCEECDDVHTPDDECPFVCEHCDEKKCECSASE